MAQRLTSFALLTVVVVGLHACVGRAVGQRLDDLQRAAALPPRIQVAYIEELKPSQPPSPPTAAPVPPPPRRSPVAPRPPKAAAPPATAASVPVPGAPASGPSPDTAASDAKPTDEPETLESPEVSAIASAASAPTVAETASAASTPTASAASSPSADAAGFTWPASTRLTYQLGGQYRGELHGSAQVEWVRQGDRYQVFMDISSGPLYTRNMRSEGRITDSGLMPSRYDQSSKVLFQEARHLSMTFDERGTVRLANGEQVPGLPSVQDTASQFVQLTYLFRRQPEMLRPGNRIEMPLALPRHVNLWVYDVMQSEVLDTPVGPLETFQLKPRRIGAHPSDLSAHIWFAPTLQYLPVRIRIMVDENNHLDLTLSKPPELGRSE